MKYSDVPPFFLLLFFFGKDMLLLWDNNYPTGGVGRSEEPQALDWIL